VFLNVSELVVRYANAGHDAVAGVSFGLAAGQLGVLIGPSGCGKTTLLRTIAGLEAMQHGRVEVDGQTLGAPGLQVPPERRRVGMVFQDYALFPHLDVARNVAFGLRGLNAAQVRQRVNDVLELVGLQSLAKRYAHELSGGQQQRVALARALAPQPRLLLLDEPFSNLDVELRERLAHELREILKAADVTTLMVTHDQLEAFAMGDTIGVMHRGRLHQWANAYTLYHEPSTRFVADFIGHGVLAPAQRQSVQQNDGRTRWWLHTPLGDVPLNPEAPASGATPTAQPQPQPMVVPRPDGVQPEPCEVLLRADDVVHDDAAPIRAEIIRKAFRGSEFLYTLRLASGQTLLAHVPSHHDHALGEWIGVRLVLDHVVIFELGGADAAPLPAPVAVGKAWAVRDGTSEWPIPTAPTTEPMRNPVA
jgi:iron(III) transport system ATP-binding protein